MRTELHFHLLPGIDDGPRDLDEAVELARLAVADGTGVVTATPHVRDLLRAGALAELPARVREVQDALDAAGVPLAVRTGAELAHHDLGALTDDELEGIAQGPADRRWILIEAPLFGDAEGFLDATAELRSRGFGTLIGHPAQRSGFELVRSGQADLIASDAHRPERPPRLTAALAVLADAGVPAERRSALAALPGALLEHGITPLARAA